MPFAREEARGFDGSAWMPGMETQQNVLVLVARQQEEARPESHRSHRSTRQYGRGRIPRFLSQSVNPRWPCSLMSAAEQRTRLS